MVLARRRRLTPQIPAVLGVQPFVPIDQVVLGSRHRHALIDLQGTIVDFPVGDAGVAWLIVADQHELGQIGPCFHTGR